MLTVSPHAFTGLSQKKVIPQKDLNTTTNNFCRNLSTLQSDCIEFTGKQEPRNIYTGEDVYVTKADGPIKNIKTAGYVYLDGGVVVEGEIKAGKYVLMEEGSVVKGNVTANGKVIAKTGCVIHGDVESKTDIIQLKDKGTVVKGNVKGKHKIEVFSGAVIEGNATTDSNIHVHGEGSTIKKDATGVIVEGYGGVIEGKKIKPEVNTGPKKWADYFKK